MTLSEDELLLILSNSSYAPSLSVDYNNYCKQKQ